MGTRTADGSGALDQGAIRRAPAKVFIHQWHSTKLVSYLIAMSREGGPASSESQSDTDSHRGQVRSFP